LGEEHSWVRGWGAARPQTIFATICLHVRIADKLSGSELKTGLGSLNISRTYHDSKEQYEPIVWLGFGWGMSKDNT